MKKFRYDLLSNLVNPKVSALAVNIKNHINTLSFKIIEFLITPVKKEFPIPGKLINLRLYLFNFIHAF